MYDAAEAASPDMQHAIATVVALSLIMGSVAAVLIAWRFQKPGTNEPKWSVTTSTIAVLLVTLFGVLFLTYRTYNAVIGGEGNGNWTTLPSIRTGNYISLLGLLASLTATRKMRWPLLVASCLMEFFWFSQGMSLQLIIDAVTGELKYYLKVRLSD
jgi:uncharacterized membrane protein